MTNIEAIQSEVLILPLIFEKTLDKAATDAGLIGSEEYSAQNDSAVKIASIRVLKNLVGLDRITEGGFTVALNSAAIERRIAVLTGGEDSISKKPTLKAFRGW